MADCEDVPEPGADDKAVRPKAIIAQALGHRALAFASMAMGDSGQDTIQMIIKLWYQRRLYEGIIQHYLEPRPSCCVVSVVEGFSHELFGSMDETAGALAYWRHRYVGEPDRAVKRAALREMHVDRWLKMKYFLAVVFRARKFLLDTCAHRHLAGEMQAMMDAELEMLDNPSIEAAGVYHAASFSMGLCLNKFFRDHHVQPNKIWKDPVALKRAMKKLYARVEARDACHAIETQPSAARAASE